MRQTIKFAMMRAANDPDRTTDTGGTYYGNNLSRYTYATNRGHRYATSRGAYRMRATH